MLLALSSYWAAGYTCEPTLSTLALYLLIDRATRWELVQSVSIDWKIITGNRGCRWGAFLVYFPFRILVVAFYVCAILGLYELKPDQAAVSRTITRFYRPNVADDLYCKGCRVH